jgi:hypothetical protein
MPQGCGYTLWHLEPTARKNWLEAALVLVYKYNFSEPEPLSEKVLGLMRILINSLAAHVHMCSKFGKTEGLGTTMRSRELSETSLGPVGTATLQGTEENSAYNSRNSPTSNAHQRMEEVLLNGQEREEEDEDEDDMLSLPSDQKEPELETIFENARSESPDSPPPVTMAKSVISAENPLFYSMLPHASPHHRRDQRINRTSSKGLPPGWTMQVMENGKILYVDNNNQITTWADPRASGFSAAAAAAVPAGGQLHSYPHTVAPAATTRRGPFFNSPPSPLSLMDVLTIGSGGAALAEERKPLTAMRIGEDDEEDEEEEEFYENGKMETDDGEEVMLHPPPERLLPIGAAEPLRCGGRHGGGGVGLLSGPAKAASKQHQSLSLLDRVWQVLGSSAETEDCLPLVGNDGVGGRAPLQSRSDGQFLVESEQESATAGLPAQPVHEAVRPTVSAGRQRKLGTAKEPPPPPAIMPSGGGGAKEATADSVSEAGGGWMTADSAQSSYCDHPPFKDLHGGSSSGRSRGELAPAYVLRQSKLRVGEDTVVDRCTTCGAIREKYAQVGGQERHLRGY